MISYNLRHLFKIQISQNHIQLREKQKAIDNFLSAKRVGSKDYNNQMEPIKRQQNKLIIKNTVKFYLGPDQRYIVFNSQFDSGNIKVVRRISDFQYKLECVNDSTRDGQSVNSKSWFYFQVSGFPKNTKGRFFVNKVQALSSIYYSKYSKFYRPVYRVKGDEWKRFATQIQLNANQKGEIECVLEYTFKNEQETVQFAFCYPYQYEKHLNYLTKISSFLQDEQIYFRKEVLIQSSEKRPIHLLTVTSQQQNNKQKEELFNQNLFPFKDRPLKFKKPVVLMTARVHPGQTPSSYAMQGVVDFLLNKSDLRAELLRKMFVFMIVPMINVDGVYHGHFRMDIFGKNLNRFYTNPNIAQQPAIYAIKQLAKHLTTENRLSLYFDLHGHNAKKGCFIYGNAFSNFVEQVESQVFCKLFSMNNSGFEYQYCNFSEKHMNAKDRFEDLTKQGCGRVVMHKTAKIIHSYSLQCGIIAPNNCNQVPQPSNSEFKIEQKEFEADQKDSQDIKLPDQTVVFSINSYKNIGKNLLVSILDVFDNNPYNRVYNSRYKSMDMLRRLTAFEVFHSAQRFRMFERSIFAKVKNINILIHEILNTKPQYKQLYNNLPIQEFELVDWPKNIVGFAKTANYRPKKFKSLYEAKLLAIDDQNMKLGKTTSLKETPLDNNEADVYSDLNLFQQQIVDPSSTIEMQRCQTIQKDLVGNSREVQIQGVLVSEQRAHEAENSDQSQCQQEEINKQILLMCENQKEESQLIEKILQNKFNQKDLELIEEKFKNKNIQEKLMIQKNGEVNFSHPEIKNKVSMFNREFSYRKKGKFQMVFNRKLSDNSQVQKVQKRYYKKQASTAHKNQGDNKEPTVEQSPIKKITAAEQFRKNIYDAIKQEIKQGLRKEYARKKISERMDNKLIDSFRMKNHQKFKGNHNYTDAKRMKSKVRLPSLGANMYIITTSTRLLQKS